MTEELTDKQQKFVEEYLIDLNATQAAIRAGYSLRECGQEAGYYVYLITDSRNGEIFYVGKGKGQRHAAHLREWRSDRFANTDKCARIGEVITAGGKIIAYCFAGGLSEVDAFAIERQLIHKIGIDRLTNAARGQAAQAERDISHAKYQLTRVKGFEQWMAERSRTEFEQSLYWAVISGYREIASGDWLRRTQQHAARVAA